MNDPKVIVALDYDNLADALACLPIYKVLAS
ncbi:orotidine 5'-phosphate decarboxylase [Vibrio cholerae]|nr:orotidine 5'-phosphate decarboxylase [Vibrio cholerae]